MSQIQLTNQLQKITTFIFDVDGVLTDGTLISYENGDLARTFHVRDGYALVTAIRLGYKIAIITGGKQESIKTRLSALGIKDIFLAVKTDKKLAVFEKFLVDNDLKPEQVLYMGDDMPDIEVLQAGVLATCPADAVQEIKNIAHYISPTLGGKGCVREVIEMVTKAQNKWGTIL